MGLFDLFKKKKEESSEAAAPEAATPQVPAPATVEDLPNSTIANPEAVMQDVNGAIVTPTQNGDFSNGMNNDQSNTFTPEVPDSIFSTDSSITETTEPVVDNNFVADNNTVQEGFAVPESNDVQEKQDIDSNYFGVPETNFAEVPGVGEGNLNTVVDNTNPVEVDQQSIEEQKSEAQDIMPSVEDVAALIDDPIAAKSEEENMAVDPETVFEGGESQEVEAVSDDFEDTLFENNNVVDIPTVDDNESFDGQVADNDEVVDMSSEVENKNDEVADYSGVTWEKVNDFSNENGESNIVNIADLIPSIDKEVNNESTPLTEMDLNNQEEKTSEEDNNPHLDLINDKMDEESEEDNTESVIDASDEVIVPTFEPVDEGPFKEKMPVENNEEVVELNGISDEDIEQEQKVAVEDDFLVDNIQTVEDTSEDVIYEDFEEPLEVEKKEEEEAPVVVEEVKEEVKEPPVLSEEKEFTIFDLPRLNKNREEDFMPRRVRVEEEAAGIFTDSDDTKDDDIDINEMYNKLEFKNEKIRFCDTCGAMILDETTNVCPNCGEPL